MSEFRKTGEYVREVMRCAAEGFVHDGDTYIPGVEVTFAFDGGSLTSAKFSKRGVELGTMKTDESERIGETGELSLQGLGVSIMLKSTPDNGDKPNEWEPAYKMSLDKGKGKLWLIDHGDDVVSVKHGKLDIMRMNYSQFSELLYFGAQMMVARAERGDRNHGKG